MNIRIAHQAVLSWFRSYGRDLPWRKKISQSFVSGDSALRVKDKSNSWFSSEERDPYKVLVSELMLQQTQVDRVLPKYLEFLAKWPTVKDLANASLAEIIIAWQGLGYNRRAKFLYQTCQKVMKDYSGQFPKTELELMQFPGIGKYTARAILAFAFGLDVGVSDVNIQRIFSRAWIGVERSEMKGSSKEMWELIDQDVPKGAGDPWSQALMDIGATVCIAGIPKCEKCPLQSLCSSNRSAQDQGFESYGFALLKNKKIQKNRPKKTIKFQETDRYFRGRVLDYLRTSSLPMETLGNLMREDHGLIDKSRWGRIIEQLMVDGLIQISGSIVHLPKV